MMVSAATMRIVVQQDIEDTQGTVTTVFFDDVVLRITSGIGGPGPNLAPNPTFAFGEIAAINSVTLDTTTLTIDGSAVGYTVNISNFTSNTISSVVVQGITVQPGTERAANGFSVSCGGAFGDLPPGSCDTVGTFQAQNSIGGNPLLTAGPAIAIFEVRIGGVTFDTFTVPITLQ